MNTCAHRHAEAIAAHLAEDTEGLERVTHDILRLGVRLGLLMEVFHGSAPRIVRNWLDGFWLRSYAESEKHKPETIHETH